jgi:asparagine synthase (glutamine-hydrolysing)
LVIASVNGEIYNHKELRAGLAQTNTLSNGDSDCHVVPSLYEQGGLHGLAALEGIYAGSIVDLRTMTLILFKDRFGARPLYYVLNDSGIFFASEIKALLTLPFVHVNLNCQAALEYFSFQAPLQRHTLFAGIETLLPGECLLYRDGDMTIMQLPDRRKRYEDLSFPEAVDATRQALDMAIRRQWRPGASSYLSSGVDTNAIVATQALQERQPHTYTAVFPARNLDPYDSGADESVRAGELASTYRVPHTKTMLSPQEFARALPRIIWHLEDLRMPMSFGAWEISRQASARNPVLFSGMGGDELFAGYVDRIKELAPGEASDDAWLTSYSSMWSTRMVTADERLRFFGPLGAPAERGHGPEEALRDQFNWARSLYGTGPVRRLLALERSFYLPGLLIVDDRMSMAHSVETRVPLIDYQLADVAETVPEAFLVRNGLGKLLLRHAIMDRVVTSVAMQPKQPFRVPEATWYRRELAAWAADALLGKRSAIRAFIEPAFVEAVLLGHVSGARNRRRLIWSLLSFEYWCRIFLTADIRPASECTACTA